MEANVALRAELAIACGYLRPVKQEPTPTEPILLFQP